MQSPNTFERNKAALVRHFDEVLNRGQLDVIDVLYSERYVLDAPVQTDGSAATHGLTFGREGLKRRVTLFRTGFPDIHFTVDCLIAEGDHVVAQYTFTGTHTGPFLDLEATGHTVSVKGILIARMNNGQIERADSVFDNGDLMQQLGLRFTPCSPPAWPAGFPQPVATSHQNDRDPSTT